MDEQNGIMSFLMVYGWAILVVIAAIAAMAYFGVFEDAFKKDVCCKTLVIYPNATPTYGMLDKNECGNTLPDGSPRLGATREIVDESFCKGGI